MPEPDEMKTLERPLLTRGLENKALFLYPIFGGSRLAIGDAGTMFFDDVW